MLLDMLCYMRITTNGGLHPMILSYDTSRPYSVTIQVTQDIIWEFARELLINGMVKCTGDGDVTIEPCVWQPDDDYDPDNYIEITLKSSDRREQLSIFIKQEVVAHFINMTFTAVPYGSESEYLDIDELDNELELLVSKGEVKGDQ